MSKTQDKRKQRAAEAAAFIKERRTMQLMVFEQAFETGLRIYEDNKDKMSADEISMIERQMKENQDIILKLKEEIDGLDSRAKA